MAYLPWLRRLAWANLVANIAIVITGGAVRLTGSGLGCPTWPRCSEESYVPHGQLGIHGAIEFGNRTLTFVLGLIALACFAVALTEYVRERRLGPQPLVLSLVVLLGIPAQAVIGGITVRTDLNPWVVALHFLVSMAIIGVCVRLLDVLTGPVRDAVPPAAQRLTWLVFATGWAVLYLGTVVTGSGPHSGDLDSRRTGLDPQLMSHVHAAAVYLLVALTVGTVALAIRGGHRQLGTAAVALLFVEVTQGAIGFVQYFTDLPALLVGLHLLGAALTSVSLTWLVLAARAHRPVGLVSAPGTPAPA